jgi:hypothetical protein
VTVRREAIDEDLLVDFPAGRFRGGNGGVRLRVHFVARRRGRRREGRLGLLAHHFPLDDAAAERADGESGQNQAI